MRRPRFDAYWFADYSGARSDSAQRAAIRLAQARGAGAPALRPERFTRASLRDATFVRLQAATQAGERMLLGFDHQVGLPFGLAQELGLHGRDGKDALRSFVRGDYAADGVRVSDLRSFAPAFNAWCVARGRPPYFYSAIRGAAWGLPTSDPRKDESTSTRYRRCERHGLSPLGRGAPKPLNRVGDQGSVGGQSLLGWVELVALIDACAQGDIPLRVWPLDGLDLGAPGYADAHVWVEPYPAAVRALGVPYDDANDALAATIHAQHADRTGQLEDPFNLGVDDEDAQRIIGFEGWIFGYRAPTGTGRRRRAGR